MPAGDESSEELGAVEKRRIRFLGRFAVFRSGFFGLRLSLAGLAGGASDVRSGSRAGKLRQVTDGRTDDPEPL